MMRLPFILFLLSTVYCSDVLDYSGSDFDDKVKEHDTVLIEFFAPWCGHCKRLAPEYEKAATTLKDNDPPVSLIKVDCTSDSGKETCSKYGVSGYPTLKIFRQGEFSSEYNGPREANGIIKFMKAQVGPSSKEVNNAAEAEKLLDKDDVFIFGFFKDKNSGLKEEFMKVADKLRESINFAHTFNDAVMKKYEFSDDIVLFRPKKLKNKFEDQTVKYDGTEDKSKLEKFIDDNFHGLMGHRTQENYLKFKTPLVVAYFDVDYIKNAKGTNYWRNRLMKVADKYKNKLHFAISSKTDFAAEMDEYGLDTKSDKPVIGGKDEKSRKYRMTDDYSPETFAKFLDDYLAGNLKAHLKSEPIPDSNDGPVKVAVAENFEELITNNDKDILIEFYAPWCGHCKKLAPTFEELGTKMIGENVDIIKMDATANDVPGSFEVHGFPTLYWLPKTDKESPKRYEAGREVDDFVKYIAEHSTDELKGWDRKGKKKSDKSEL